MWNEEEIEFLYFLPYQTFEFIFFFSHLVYIIEFTLWLFLDIAMLIFRAIG